ncbi:MAG: riboflavin kinase [Firmicutes bacterium]|nr:riboflavin kinase [Bacillota bacterium]
MAMKENKIFLGIVSAGDGRGKELGFPTANISMSDLICIDRDMISTLVGNDYPNDRFGFSKLLRSYREEDFTIWQDTLSENETKNSEQLDDFSDNIFSFMHGLFSQLISHIDELDNASANFFSTKSSLSREILKYLFLLKSYTSDQRGENDYLTKSEGDGDKLPEDGVYAGRLGCENATLWPAAISLGTREHFYDNGIRLLEAHVIDFRGDLYDQLVLIQITRFLRDQEKFDNLESLIGQIEKDIEMTKKLFDEYS